MHDVGTSLRPLRISDLLITTSGSSILQYIALEQLTPRPSRAALLAKMKIRTGFCWSAGAISRPPKSHNSYCQYSDRARGDLNQWNHL